MIPSVYSLCLFIVRCRLVFVTTWGILSFKPTPYHSRALPSYSFLVAGIYVSHRTLPPLSHPPYRERTYPFISYLDWRHNVARIIQSCSDYALHVWELCEERRKKGRKEKTRKTSRKFFLRVTDYRTHSPKDSKRREREKNSCWKTQTSNAQHRTENQKNNLVSSWRMTHWWSFSRVIC